MSSSQNVMPSGVSDAEVEGLRLSVTELSEQVQRYAEAAEGLTEELDSARDAATKTEEEVRCQTKHSPRIFLSYLAGNIKFERCVQVVGNMI